ncbi:hypothetical protein EGW08_011807, partial [Elysia chlorotica]
MPDRGGLSFRPVLTLLLLLSVISVVSATLASCNNTRTVLTSSNGTISDGLGDYKEGSHCEWLIDAGEPNKKIFLEFINMSTECSYDFLFVYDGDSYESPLIATLSGDRLPRPMTAYSGKMLLYLFSDRNHALSGFVAKYEIQNCPFNCSGHGKCKDYVCECNAGYSGIACEVKNCPEECGPYGTCNSDSEQQRCSCVAGYTGQGCDLAVAGSVDEGRWYTIMNESRSTSLPKRTAHTAVYTHDCIWVFGGFDLNSVLDDLWHFCLEENIWSEVTSRDAFVMWPAARSGHAMDKFGDGFYIFGGRLSNGSRSNELWFFNISSLNWSLCAEESRLQPHGVHGHTLTTVRDHLYVVGGSDEDFMFVDKIYRISAAVPDHWEIVPIWGGVSTPPILVGHSTVYHAQSDSLYVYGGYRQNSGLFSDCSNTTYRFDLASRYWSSLYGRDWTLPSYARAFHSGVLMGQYLVVYGGKTHQHLNLEVCYNSNIFFYHLGCHKWLNHNHFTTFFSTGNATMPERGRFGHTAVVANGNIMFIIGGYSGQVLGDVVAYKVPQAVADYEVSR